MSTSSRRWCTRMTCRWPNEDPSRALVRLFADGDHRHHHIDLHALGQHEQRPSRHVDVVAGGGGHHAGLSHRLYADGHGRVFRVAQLPLGRSRYRHASCARPDGAARLRGDEQRRADRHSPVRVHGLSGRARRLDRQALQELAPGDGAGAGFAGGGHHRHLRDLRHRHRDCRCSGDPDGAAGLSGDVACRLQLQGGGRRDHRRRLPRYPDSALGAVDRLRRDRRCFGGATVCGCIFSRPDVSRVVCGLHRGAGQAAAGPDAATA